MIPQFSFTHIPNIVFGAGKLNELNKLIKTYGKTVLFATGGQSLKKSGHWAKITKMCEQEKIQYFETSIVGEPSPSFIDIETARFKEKGIHLVISIGGGSVLDGGKALSAMLPQDKGVSVKTFLEGIGTKEFNGHKLPFIAIPTTSGTGSEATKNAVLSEIGKEGYKKSLRHDNLVPDVAVIDPELMVSCPPDITAACGLDALTQLIEAYTSNIANPLTDTITFSGIKHIKGNIWLASTTESLNVTIRSEVAYGTLMSGIALANAGLGIVHGIAGSLGGLFPIPHGVICGTLLAEATKTNINALKKQGKAGIEGLRKYAEVGLLISCDGSCGTSVGTSKDLSDESKTNHYCEELVNMLVSCTEKLKIPRLGKFCLSNTDLAKIVKGSSLKNNPVKLTTEEITQIIANRL
jgi:alcohol dehydrogenase class IV